MDSANFVRCRSEGKTRKPEGGVSAKAVEKIRIWIKRWAGKDNKKTKKMGTWEDEKTQRPHPLSTGSGSEGAVQQGGD